MKKATDDADAKAAQDTIVLDELKKKLITKIELAATLQRAAGQVQDEVSELQKEIIKRTLEQDTSE